MIKRPFFQQYSYYIQFKYIFVRNHHLFVYTVNTFKEDRATGYRGGKRIRRSVCELAVVLVRFYLRPVVVGDVVAA